MRIPRLAGEVRDPPDGFDRPVRAGKNLYDWTI